MQDTRTISSRTIDTGWLGKAKSHVVANAEGFVDGIVELPITENPALIENHNGNAAEATKAIAERLAKTLPVEGEWTPMGVTISDQGNASIRYRATGVKLLPDQALKDIPNVNHVRSFILSGAYTEDLYRKALADELSQGKLRPLVESLTHAGAAFKAADEHEEFEVLANELTKDPQALKEIEDELAKGGSTSFRFVGKGKGGIYLEGNNGLVIGIRDHVPERIMIPHNIQPLHGFKKGGFGFEILPRLDVDSVEHSDLHQISHGVKTFASPKGARFEVNDPELRNIGRAPDGIAYYLDRDGINRSHEKGVPTLPHEASHWVRPDGTWSQYHAYREQHEAFNSPLHQGGGKLDIPYEPYVAPTKAPRSGNLEAPWKRGDSSSVTPKQSVPADPATSQPADAVSHSLQPAPETVQATGPTEQGSGSPQPHSPDGAPPPPETPTLHSSTKMNQTSEAATGSRSFVERILLNEEKNIHAIKAGALAAGLTAAGFAAYELTKLNSSQENKGQTVSRK